MNFDRLRHVAERADLGGAARGAAGGGDSRSSRAASCRFCEALGQRSVTEFNYRYEDAATRAASSSASALREGRRRSEAVLAALRAAGYRRRRHDRQRDGEAARALHGGRAARGHRATRCCSASNFPERPGALLQFLQAIGTRWNISLFHYRNHGSDHGRVLAGIQVPPPSARISSLHLNELQYAYAEETANPAYRMFLGA